MKYIIFIQYTKYQKLVIAVAALIWYFPQLSLNGHPDYAIPQDYSHWLHQNKVFHLLIIVDLNGLNIYAKSLINFLDLHDFLREQYSRYGH